MAAFYLCEDIMNFDEYNCILLGIGEEFENNERALEAYNKLAEALKDKNYFAVTMCMDDIIFKSNLSNDRIVAPMGGFRQKQCPDGCNHALFNLTEEKCPVCGKELVYNNIKAPTYVEEGYLPMWDKHKKWLSGTLNKSLLVLELGVSMRLPQVIRWPFEKIVFLNNKASFIRVNETLPQLSQEVGSKGKSVHENSVDWILEN